MDGDYWHGCPTHFPDRRPGGPNGPLWQEKFARTKERDERSSVLAGEAGWTVVRLWECEVRASPKAAAALVLALKDLEHLFERHAESILATACRSTKLARMVLAAPAFKFVDLFAGVGGFHAALKSYGGRCVYSVEIDKAAADVYHRNWGRTRLVI